VARVGQRGERQRDQQRHRDPGEQEQGDARLAAVAQPDAHGERRQHRDGHVLERRGRVGVDRLAPAGERVGDHVVGLARRVEEAGAQALEVVVVGRQRQHPGGEERHHHHDPDPLEPADQPLAPPLQVPVEAEQAERDQRDRRLGVLLGEDPGGRDEPQHDRDLQPRLARELDLEQQRGRDHQHDQRLHDPDAVVDDEEREHRVEARRDDPDPVVDQPPPQQEQHRQRQQPGGHRHQPHRVQRREPELDPDDPEPDLERLAADRHRVPDVVQPHRAAVGEVAVGPLVEEVREPHRERDAGGEVERQDRARRHEQRGATAHPVRAKRLQDRAPGSPRPWAPRPRRRRRRAAGARRRAAGA